MHFSWRQITWETPQYCPPGVGGHFVEPHHHSQQCRRTTWRTWWPSHPQIASCQSQSTACLFLARMRLSSCPQQGQSGRCQGGACHSRAPPPWHNLPPHCCKKQHGRIRCIKVIQHNFFRGGITTLAAAEMAGYLVPVGFLEDMRLAWWPSSGVPWGHLHGHLEGQGIVVVFIIIVVVFIVVVMVFIDIHIACN